MPIQLAARLQPYLMYFVIGQLILLCLAIVIGGFLILRRFLGKGSTPSSMLDNAEIALEITEEIRRLHELRQKILPGFAGDIPGMGVGAIGGSTHAHAISATGEPSVLSSGPGAGASDAEKEAFAAKVSAEMRAHQDRLQAQIVSYEIKIKQLEAEVATAVAAANQPSAANAKPDPNAIKAEIDKAMAAANAEKNDLSKKVDHLEKVLSEYRIFEEDFALVKKYKAENETLKKQLSAGGTKVSETDIDNLFTSVSSPDASAQPKVDSDNFFGNDVFAGQTETAPAAAPTPAAAAAPAPAPTPAAAPAEIPPILDGGKTMSQADIDALLGGGGTPAPAADPAPATEATPTKPEDLEALAESSVNDDKLIEEFEKILGEKAQ